MNQSQPYLDSQHSHLSAGPSYATQSQTAGGMSHYSQYPQQTASLQNGPGAYAPNQSYGGQYYSGVTSPQAAGQPVSTSMGTQLLPLPAMGASHPHNPYAAPGSHGQAYPQQTFDSTGQVAPPGVKPRVTATLWEDEGSLCFQVEAKGVCVARREDNHFINGTKLLNVAGMTRGRRDGILKSEKTRHVVKIGPMHLKGVWIPFDRALDFANREKITELLYPLFVHNIGALLYHPTNSNRTNMIMEATKRRSLQDKAQPMIGNAGPQSTGLHHHHSMNNQMAPQVTQPPHSIAPHPGANRPPLERSHTFPTPPTSASSLITTQGSSYEWGNQNMSGSVQSSTQPLAIDTGLSNARSLPSTPATTPPGNAIHGLPGSYPSQQSYDNSRPMYSAAPQQQSQFATQQQNLARFGQPMQPNVYMKNDMGPPSRQTGSGAEGDPTDIKQDPYSHGHSNDQLGHGTGEEEAEHEHDTEYAHDNSAAYNANRGAYNYNTSSTIGSMHGEHPHLSPEQVNGSPHQNGSGRVTPRTSSVSQPQWNSGYNTPPRTAGSAGLYNVVSDTRGTATNGHSVSDNYSSSGYASTAVNGVTTSNKRAREDDDSDYKTRPGSGGDDIESLKRRKSGREDSLGNGPASFAHDGQGMNRNRATVIQRRRP